MFTRTKTLCTLGPASDSKDMILNLVEAGMDGVRLNFSHGSHEYYTKMYDNITKASAETAEPVAVLVDLQGPRIRIGELASNEIELKKGDKIEVTTENIKGTKDKISISYEPLPSDARAGDKILIDDGLIRLEVTSVKPHSVECVVLNGGLLRPRKGVNLPGMKLSLLPLTQKDYDDIYFALRHRADYIALSFVREASDIKLLRDHIKTREANKFIIAKIENQEAVNNFDGILQEADGIMVARGDLGVELPPENVPYIQKEIIRKCSLAGKLVITATQMLDSMIERPMPTRAEASDVANAVWDGTDVVMLSGETAVGKYPVEAVKTMGNILRETESHIGKLKSFDSEVPLPDEENLFDSAGKAVVNMAIQTNAAAIVTMTRLGRFARIISRYRPYPPIVALSDNLDVTNMLRLNWGVIPVHMDVLSVEQGLNLIRDRRIVNAGETVIIASGSPTEEKGADISIRIAVI